MRILNEEEPWFDPVFWKDQLDIKIFKNLTKLTYKQIKNIQIILKSYLPKDDNWHLIAVTLDVDNIKIYINNKLIYLLNYDQNQYINKDWSIGTLLLLDKTSLIIDKTTINY